MLKDENEKVVTNRLLFNPIDFYRFPRALPVLNYGHI